MFISQVVNRIDSFVFHYLLCSILGLNDQLFDDLNKRLKATGAADYIQSLKELYVDFMGKVKKENF